jgi:4,4'-diaponeurosporenoate glycosyltransferase
MIGPVVAAGWIAGWLAAGPVRRLPADLGHVGALGAGETGAVSVVVPVRNEEARLPGLLRALAADRAAGAINEIVVVDDGSTDASAALARRAGARVVTVEPPAGWTGKAWGCWRGANEATGDVVVFLDADTEPAPGFVGRLAAAAWRTGGMVSVQPTHRVERVYERASAVPNLVALMAGTGPARAGSRWRGPVGFGPALAVPRAAYLAAGGHRLVAGDVAEDVALARALAASGMRVTALADAGAGDIEYRMYPEGWRALVQGWTKNLAAGAGKLPPLRTALIALWISGALLAVLTVRSAPLGYGLFAAQFAVLLRRAGRFGILTALCYAVPLVIFVGLFARSAALRLSRRPVAWRGRWVSP